MTLYKNKYRNESIRLPGWNYSSNGHYFVTICTRDRRYFLGQVANGEMQLSPAGEIAQQFWYDIPNRFPHIELDQFVVMPNHIHGIIVINSPNIHISCGNNFCGDAINRVPAINIPAINIPAINIPATKIPTIRGGVTGKHNPMLSTHALGKIIRWYKGRCTFEIRSIEIQSIAPKFAWQSRFHDYIIRDDLTLNRIRNYIVQNPEKWKGDRTKIIEMERRCETVLLNGDRLL